MAHQTTIRVRFAELDPYNHVNHAQYLTYFEVGRVEALDSIGLGIAGLTAEGIQIVVVDIAVSYKIPATLGDELVVETRVDELARASTHWSQDIHRGDELIASARLRAAVLGANGRPKRIPAEFAERLHRLV